MIAFIKWLAKLHTKNRWRKITNIVGLYKWYKITPKITIIVNKNDFETEELAEKYVLDWFNKKGKFLKKLKEPIVTKEGIEIFAKGNDSSYKTIQNGNVTVKVFSEEDDE